MKMTRRPGFYCLLCGVVSLLALVRVSHGLRKDELFPYGPTSGDEQLPPNSEDVSSQEIALDTHIKFFGREYGSVYVRNLIII